MGVNATNRIFIHSGVGLELWTNLHKNGVCDYNNMAIFNMAHIEH